MVHMRDLFARSGVLLFLTVLTGLFITDAVTKIDVLSTEPAYAQSPASANANPLLAKWSGPYGGVPPFDRVQIAYFKPALETAMAESLSEVGKIASNPAAPTFENTIAELERSGRTLDRVTTIYSVWGGTMASPEFQVVQREMAPKLAAFNDQITQNEGLFKRIEAVYNSPDKKKLTPEQQRLTRLYYTNFVRSGANLGTEAKARLSQINQELAGLFTRFSQNVLAEETDQSILLTSEAELSGLPISVRVSAAAAAAR
jgi:peptidyl-dipeptidase Dcp